MTVAADVAVELQDRFGTPTVFAWTWTAERLRAHGRPPGTDTLRDALAACDPAGSKTAAKRRAGLLFCVLSAVRIWGVDADGEGLLLHVPDLVRNILNSLSLAPHETVALLSALTSALERLPGASAAQRLVLVDAHTMLACVEWTQALDAERNARREALLDHCRTLDDLLADPAASVPPETRLPAGMLLIHCLGLLAEQCGDPDDRVVLQRRMASVAERAEADVLPVLWQLAALLVEEGLTGNRRFLTRAEAEHALALMSVLTPDGRPSPRTASDQGLACLAVVMGAVHPHHAGHTTARALFDLEIAWLGMGVFASTIDGKRYLENAFEAIHRWMCDAELPSSHRRVYAGQVSRLARVGLDRSRGLPGLTVVERVRLHDLSGAAFYRAESTFYGQGECHWARTNTEPGWRLDLYRARHQMDHRATIVTYDELKSRLDQSFVAQIEGDLAKLRHYEDHTGGVVFGQTIVDPRGEIDRLREDILRIRSIGHARGWSPALVETTPAPVAAEIEAWLRKNPQRGLLVAGVDELGLVHATRDGAIQCIEFDALCGEAMPAMLAAATALTTAWEGMLAGSTSRGDLAAALAAALESDGWRFLAERIATAAVAHGLTCLAVVERGPWRTFPWNSLLVGDGTLGDRVAIVYLPTLAASGAQPGAPRTGMLAYVGAAEGTSPGLEYGRASFRAAGDRVVGPLGREAFEAACTRAGAIRVFTHGEFKTIDAPLSGIVLDANAPEQAPYQGYEITTMDLRGCGRVELWSCDSGIQSDFLGKLLGNDEPLGIASCFLLAGAHVVIGSLWEQPALAAGLIAAAFAALAGAPAGAEDDARTLARAVAAYRREVGPGGRFEDVVVRALAAGLRAERPAESIVTRAVHTAWIEVATTLAGRGPVSLPLSAVQGFETWEPMLDDARREVHDEVRFVGALREVACELTDVLRRADTWAGWRVLARDRSVI